MATRAQLLATVQTTALAALTTDSSSIPAAMTALKNGLAGDPSTAIPANQPEVGKAIDEISARGNVTMAKDIIYALTTK